MALTDYQRMEVRRHMGYPMIGSPTNAAGGTPYTSSLGQGSGLLGFRFFEYYALMEWRMVGMSAVEEVALLGNQSQYFTNFYTTAQAQVVVGGTATSGDTLTLQLNGNTISYTMGGTDTLATAAAGLANAINTNAQVSPIVMATATGTTVKVQAKIIGSRSNSLTIIAFNGTSITGTVQTVGGATSTSTLVGGVDPPGPRFTDPTETVAQPYFGYLPIIQYHEQQLPLALSGQDTIQADVFTQRQDEQAARYGSYQLWCKRLAQFIGVPYRGAGNYDGMGPRRRIV